MKIHRHAGWLPVLLAGVWISAVHAADEPPNKGRMSAAIVNGLGVLAKEADGWTAKESCLACDQMPLVLWAHGEAALRGFDIDRNQVDKWLAWAGPSTDAKAGPEALDFVVYAALRANRKIPASMKPVAMSRYLLSLQQPDGTWLPTGHFAKDQRRPPAEAKEVATWMTLLALDILRIDKERTDRARQRAWQFLSKGERPQTTETLVYRLLVGAWGEREREALRESLIERQNADGGWGWQLGGKESDAYTTGMALYVLHWNPWAEPKEYVARAQEWLLTHQGDDAAWQVKSSLISTRDGEEQRAAEDRLYTVHGTAWATLGLLRAFPEERPGESPDGKTYYRNGNVEHHMEVVEGPNGEKVHSMIEYFPRGSLKFEVPITEMPGELGFGPHGIAKTYHESEKIASIIRYNKAVREGPFSLYYEDGLLRERGVFANNTSKTLERFTRAREKLDPAVRMAIETDKTKLKTTDELTVYLDSYEDRHVHVGWVFGYRWVDSEWKRAYQASRGDHMESRTTKLCIIDGKDLGPGRWRLAVTYSLQGGGKYEEVFSQPIEITGEPPVPAAVPK